MTKDLKILFIPYTHSNGGGAEAVLTTLVNNLPKTWQIDILEEVSFDVKKEPIDKNVNLLPPLTKNKDRTKFGKFCSIVLQYKPQLIKNIRKLEDYDVVVGYLYFLLLPVFNNTKKIAWFQGMMNDMTSWGSPLSIGYYETKWFFNLQKKALKHVDDVIVPSNICLRCLQETFPEASKKGRIIYNGTNIKNINERSKEKIDEHRIFELFEKGIPSLIVIGRLDRNKNFSLALEAVKILKARDILCNLIVLGFETDDLDLHELSHSLDIEERVFFLGYQQNPLPFLAHSKLLLITSFCEGFPTVAIEAMSLGIPFITTPVAGASEELANGGSCGLVSDWNAQEYADNIEKLLTNEELYQTMSKNCKEHVKNYSVENYVASFERILENVPEKNNQKKIKKKEWLLSFILFIFYSSFYLSIDNRYNRNVMKMRWSNLIHKPSLLNLSKFIFRFFVYFISVLSFPFLLLYASFLTFRSIKLKEI